MVGTDDGELHKVMLVQNKERYKEAKVFMMNLSESWWSLLNELSGCAFFVVPMYFGASCVSVACGSTTCTRWEHWRIFYGH
jgi:hypothetical protein